MDWTTLKAACIAAQCDAPAKPQVDVYQVKEQIRELLAKVQEYGLSSADACVAGGCARDLAHGIVPHDIDLIVCGGAKWEDEIFQALDDLGYTCDDDAPSSAPSAGGDFCERWHRVTQYSRGDGLELDILFARDSSKTLEDIIDGFDFNINQAFIGYVHGALFGPVYLRGNDNKLRKLREAQVSCERRLHIEQVAHQLGWVVPDDDLAEALEEL